MSHITKQARILTSESTHTTHPTADFSYDAPPGFLHYEGGGTVTKDLISLLCNDLEFFYVRLQPSQVPGK